MRPSWQTQSTKQLEEEALLELASLDLSQLCDEAKIHHCLGLRGVSRCRREVHFTVVTCGHPSLCTECSRQSSTCPVCRTTLPPTNQPRLHKRLYYKCIGAGLISKKTLEDKTAPEDTEVNRLFSLFDVALDNNLVSILCRYISDGVCKQSVASTDLNFDEIVGFKEWCAYSFKKIVEELHSKKGMKPSLLLKYLSQLSGIANVLETMMSSFKSAKNDQLDEINLLLENILRVKQDLTSGKNERTPNSHELMTKKLSIGTYEGQSPSILFGRPHEVQFDFLTKSTPAKFSLPEFAANKPNLSSGSSIHMMDKTHDNFENDQLTGNGFTDSRWRMDGMTGEKKLTLPPLGEAKLQLKVFVEKKEERVIYAECDRLMVDVLFSFLTTPLGSLVRRTDMDSGLGRLDSLYQSVERLEADHFETLACRELLLRPKSAYGFAYQRLKAMINDADKETPYGCPSMTCPNYSLFPGVVCECGLNMTSCMPFVHPPPPGSDLVFIREDVGDSYIVTDDLFICPSSEEVKRQICSAVGLVQESTSSYNLEEQIFSVDDYEIVNLLKASLHSKSPLTDCFLKPKYATKPIDWSSAFLQQYFIEAEAKADGGETEKFPYGIMARMRNTIRRLLSSTFGRNDVAITLFHDGKTALCARVGRDFINLLFSFLTFPLGSIAAAAGIEGGFLMCLDNLYQVCKRFVASGFCFRKYLSNPPIALHHDYPNHLLKIGGSPWISYNTTCPMCVKQGFNMLCQEKDHFYFEVKAINPKKSGNHTTEIGGGYVRSPEVFLIKNDLYVEPIYDLQEKKFSVGLEEKHVVVTSQKALDFLMAILLFQDPLTRFLETVLD